MLGLGLLLALPAGAPAAPVEVHGLGWGADRELSRSLARIVAEGRDGLLDAAAIEDAAHVLFYELEQGGWLQPEVTAVLAHPDGTTSRHRLASDLEPPLPRPLAAQRLRLEVTRGVRHLLREVAFSGLTLLSQDEALAFFVGDSPLLSRAADRVYSPARARQSAANLEEELRLRGQAEARVEITATEIDPSTGRVRLAVTVHEGDLWRVRSVDLQAPSDAAPPGELLAPRLGRRWSALWRQDTLALVRGWYHQRGYPDVRIRATATPGDLDTDGARAVAVTLDVSPGERVEVSRIGFSGAPRTRESILRRRVDLAPGNPLDPARVSRSLARLARLGALGRVDVTTVETGPGERAVEFLLAERPPQELNVLAGYGSYEQFRGGVEWLHHNLFGRSHGGAARVVQSVKSSSGDLRYTVPDLWAADFTGTLRAFGLQREELAFVREEVGANVSLSRRLPALHASASLSYGFRRLRTSANELARRDEFRPAADVAGLELRIVHDRRDDPIRPRRGHRLLLEIEESSQALGGEVDYQQLTLAGSYHTAWGRNRWLHLGLRHAVVTTFGAPDDTALPDNVRFYPGGEDSIRGYRRGAAAPRAADGRFVGAKTYLQFNLEVEQAVTTKLSAVVFADFLGAAARLADYPYADRLAAVGAGLRYHSLIGPIRLEYGHNVSPRPADPRGTVLLSVGMPF